MRASTTCHGNPQGLRLRPRSVLKSQLYQDGFRPATFPQLFPPDHMIDTVTSMLASYTTKTRNRKSHDWKSISFEIKLSRKNSISMHSSCFPLWLSGLPMSRSGAGDRNHCRERKALKLSHVPELRPRSDRRRPLAGPAGRGRLDVGAHQDPVDPRPADSDRRPGARHRRPLHRRPP